MFARDEYDVASIVATLGAHVVVDEDGLCFKTVGQLAHFRRGTSDAVPVILDGEGLRLSLQSQLTHPLENVPDRVADHAAATNNQESLAYKTGPLRNIVTVDHRADGVLRASHHQGGHLIDRSLACMRVIREHSKKRHLVTFIDHLPHAEVLSSQELEGAEKTRLHDSDAKGVRLDVAIFLGEVCAGV